MLCKLHSILYVCKMQAYGSLQTCRLQAAGELSATASWKSPSELLERTCPSRGWTGMVISWPLSTPYTSTVPRGRSCMGQSTSFSKCKQGATTFEQLHVSGVYLAQLLPPQDYPQLLPPQDYP